jgi:HAD superfamily hydrolase (TIGR01509 family)
MRIKAVLLDLDDTLWPVVPLIQQAELVLYEWMATHTPSVVQHYSIEQLRANRNALVKTNPRFEYDLWALRHTLLSDVFNEFGEDPKKADHAMTVFAHARNQVALYDDVLPALSELSKHVLLGSVSNGFADLHAIGIASHFKVSLAAHSFGCAKPDPRIFMAACNELNLKPDQVMVVGDDLLLDVLGAQQVGMMGVWMNRHHVDLHLTKNKHVQPDAIVANLHELIEQLE